MTPLKKYPRLQSLGDAIVAKLQKEVWETEEVGVMMERGEIEEEGALHLFYAIRKKRNKYTLSVRFPFNAEMNGTFFPQSGEIFIVQETTKKREPLKPVMVKVSLVWRNQKSCVLILGKPENYNQRCDGSMLIK